MYFLIVVFFYLALSRWKKASQHEEDYLRSGLFISGSLLLLHAGFDFDFSFPLIFGLFIILATYAAEFDDRPFVVRPSIRAKTIIGTVTSVGFIVCFLLAVGYAEKAAGVRLALHGSFDGAQQKFGQATSILPWSSQTHYESSKAYLMLGNEKRDLKYFMLAKIELEKAIRLSPNEPLYKKLLADIEQVLRLNGML
ncbi:tetratricopeptide repeat protein [Paenibacillus sp. CC-CFT747]|nr:tetratricopeptide repeat protein [Paenibacillus sp. CC-CFT747]